MADTVLVSNAPTSINPDYRVWTDELVDPVSGLTVQKQIFGLVDATAGGTTRAAVGANGLAVSATIVGTVPISLATLPVTNAGTFAVQNTSVIPGVAATSLGKAEDAVAASGDTGVMALAVRNDAGTALAASGDYIPLMVNASGALYVTGGGGGTQYVEDTASAGGETMTLAGVVRQDTLGSSTTADGDYAYLKVNAQGALYTETTGTISVTGTMPIDATHLEDAVAASGDTGIPALAVRRDSASAGGADGDYVNLSTDSTGALRVAGGGGGTQYVEDTASAGGETMTLAGVVRQDTLASSLTTDGDYGYLKVNNVGALYVVQSAALPAGSNVIGALTANQSVNVAQINGVTPLMGAGNTGTGSPRVTIATDQAVLPVSDNAGSLTVDAPSTAPVSVRISDGTTAQTPVRVDNAPFTDNASNITPSGYLFDEVAGTALTENDAAAARIDSKRAQVMTIEDATTRGQRLAVSAAGAMPVDNTQAAAGTATLANVSGATSSTTLIAANAARLGFVIINDSTSILYVKLGSTASSTSYVYQLPGTVGGVPYTLESTAFPRYTGIITGIWVSATGAARVTELTA